ncbi:MAG: hypothetical protein ACRCST_17655 [Turicibacter sp.]
MIYKLLNYLKEVRVESQTGSEQLIHQEKCYEGSHLCMTVKEIKHNEIEFKINKLEGNYDKLIINFFNPIESVTGVLDDSGHITSDWVEQKQQNRCLMSSEWGTYCLGLVKETNQACTFIVNPREIQIVFDLTHADKDNLTYHVVFDKYVPIYSTIEVMRRFDATLG